jgi:hypothetical protein
VIGGAVFVGPDIRIVWIRNQISCELDTTLSCLSLSITNHNVAILVPDVFAPTGDIRP